MLLSEYLSKNLLFGNEHLRIAPRAIHFHNEENVKHFDARYFLETDIDLLLKKGRFNSVTSTEIYDVKFLTLIKQNIIDGENIEIGDKTNVLFLYIPIEMKLDDTVVSENGASEDNDDDFSRMMGMGNVQKIPVLNIIHKNLTKIYVFSRTKIKINPSEKIKFSYCSTTVEITNTEPYKTKINRAIVFAKSMITGFDKSEEEKIFMNCKLIETAYISDEMLRASAAKGLHINRNIRIGELCSAINGKEMVFRFNGFSQYVDTKYMDMDVSEFDDIIIQASLFKKCKLLVIRNSRNDNRISLNLLDRGDVEENKTVFFFINKQKDIEVDENIINGTYRKELSERAKRHWRDYAERGYIDIFRISLLNDAESEEYSLAEFGDDIRDLSFGLTVDDREVSTINNLTINPLLRDRPSSEEKSEVFAEFCQNVRNRNNSASKAISDRTKRYMALKRPQTNLRSKFFPIYEIFAEKNILPDADGFEYQEYESKEEDFPESGDGVFDSHSIPDDLLEVKILTDYGNREIFYPFMENLRNLDMRMVPSNIRAPLNESIKVLYTTPRDIRGLILKKLLIDGPPSEFNHKIEINTNHLVLNTPISDEMEVSIKKCSFISTDNKFGYQTLEPFIGKGVKKVEGFIIRDEKDREVKEILEKERVEISGSSEATTDIDALKNDVDGIDDLCPDMKILCEQTKKTV